MYFLLKQHILVHTVPLDIHVYKPSYSCVWLPSPPLPCRLPTKAKFNQRKLVKVNPN